MDQSSIDNFIENNSLLSSLAEKLRITANEIAKHAKNQNEMLVSLKLHLGSSHQNNDMKISPESPISAHKELNNHKPLEIPLDRSMDPPSPELLPQPKPISIFDETSPVSIHTNNNNINSAVEAPLSDDDETLEVTDDIELDQVVNERNGTDSGLGGANENIAVPLEVPTSPFRMHLKFNLRDLFATDQLYSTEQIINGFKWILNIQYKKKFKKGNGTIVPLLFGIFLKCTGPMENQNSMICNVVELNFKIHNSKGMPGLMKSKTCTVPFEPPYDRKNGVWFKLEEKKKMIEDGLVTEDLQIQVSVVLIFRNPSNSTHSFPDDDRLL